MEFYFSYIFQKTLGSLQGAVWSFMGQGPAVLLHYSAYFMFKVAL